MSVPTENAPAHKPPDSQGPQLVADSHSPSSEASGDTPDLVAETSGSERFPRTHRLLRRGEFVRVQQQGRRIHTAHFILLLLRAPARDANPYTRLGVTVGRRVGGAVQRNRIKRLVREVFRRNRPLFPPEYDVVLVGRPGAERLDYASVRNELVRAQAAIERIRKQWSAEPEPTTQP